MIKIQLAYQTLIKIIILDPKDRNLGIINKEEIHSKNKDITLRFLNIEIGSKVKVLEELKVEKMKEDKTIGIGSQVNNPRLEEL